MEIQPMSMWRTVSVAGRFSSMQDKNVTSGIGMKGSKMVKVTTDWGSLPVIMAPPPAAAPLKPELSDSTPALAPSHPHQIRSPDFGRISNVRSSVGADAAVVDASLAGRRTMVA